MSSVAEWRAAKDSYDWNAAEKSKHYYKMRELLVECVREEYGAAIGDLVVDPKGSIFMVYNMGLSLWTPGDDFQPVVVGFLRLKSGKISNKVYRKVPVWEAYYGE